jgi:AcrR family transcriptional regulator
MEPSERPARRRRKLEPDPELRVAIVAAASKVVRQEGVQGLSIERVLRRAELGTRAFYRHFESKDQLVAAVFLDMARAETVRIRHRMSDAHHPVDAVAAWIDARLDLAFDDDIRSDLRQLSLEAQSQTFASSGLISAAYREFLTPLVEQLERGVELGCFTDVEPEAGAMSIHGALWASVEQQWSTGTCVREDVRRRVLRFCLGGLGVGSEAITKALSGDAPTD